MNDPITPQASEDSPMDAAPAPEPTTAAPPPSPGALVRQARERAGIAADELATQIKLAKNTLDALERDDFAALSEPVYVRGYYRKIAKVLPVSEAELLAAYNASATPAKTRPAAQRIPLAGGVDAGSTRRPRGQGIGLAIIVVVVAGLLFLLADKNSPRSKSTAAPVSTDTPQESAARRDLNAPAVSNEPAPAPVAAPAATGPAAAAVPNQLVLEYSESSFVRVEDSRNKTLAIGLVRGGERQALDGTPPYSVFLGNAKNVKVFFNGQPVNFSAHINSQNDTARFTVP